MSFSIQASVSKTILLGDIANKLPGRLQEALNNTREAGLHFLRSEADLPIDTGALVATADAGNNQSSVYFKVAQAPGDDGKMYGIYQNQGWHDRGGGWHEGHHFMESTEIFASAYLQAQVAAVIFGGGLSGGLSTGSVLGFAGSTIRTGLTGPTASPFNPGGFL